jgi:hypothetical protein
VAPQKKPPGDDFSESDRRQLDDLLAEREFERRLRERRSAMWAGVKTAAQWVTAVGLVLTWAKDALVWVWQRIIN